MSEEHQSSDPIAPGATHMAPQPGERAGRRGSEEQADADALDRTFNNRFNTELAAETRDANDDSDLLAEAATNRRESDLVTGMGGGDDPISEGVDVPSDLEEVDQ
jgi:hypothetical protein